MLLPKIQTFDGRLETIDTFRGLNRAEKIAEGEWNDELNLSSDRYPMLSVRRKRKIARTIDGFVCSMIAHGEDFYFLVLPNSYITDAAAAGNTAKQVTLYKGNTSVATFSFDTANDQWPGRMIVFGAYVIIPGIQAWYNTADGTDGTITGMPKMDFVIECNNRLWGCFYGEKEVEENDETVTKVVNEIYASELGKFDSWDNYDGTSMASYAASVGTDGPWTGAVNYKGSPYFFKENYVHKVYVSASGAHQIVNSQIKGVRRSWSLGDCSESLCEFDGYLYWLSNDGICRYDGGHPVIISEALGDISRVYSACIGGTEGKLYVEITSFAESGLFSQNDFYSYDVKRGIWHVENSPLQSIEFYVEFAKAKEAFYVCQVGHGNLPGYRSAGVTTNVFDFTPTGTSNLEADVSYSCTSGLIGWQEVPQKYISRMDLRLILPAGATLKAEIEYDSDGVWHEQGTVTGGTGGGTGSVVFPVRPHRCDHFRIRLSGTGEMRLYSIAKRLTKGSDVVR